MTATLEALHWLTTAAYAAVGTLAVVLWTRRRDRQHAALALAIAGLGSVSVLGRMGPLLGYPRWAADLSIVGFLASGWGLLLFRHTVVAIPPRIRRSALVALVVVGAVTIAIRTPTDPQSSLRAVDLAAVTLTIVAWSVCVGEPAIRFWLAGHGRPFVQRRRLRALSLGYLGIVGVLVTAISTRPDLEATGARVGLQLAALALAPLLFAALAPPRWLKRRWRAREDGAMRDAMREIVDAPDATSAAQHGLDWGLRLLGAEQGFLMSTTGELLATAGLEPEDARLIATRTDGPSLQPIAVDPEERTLVASPLDDRSGGGLLAVLSGPFSPVFGRDELETLADLARTISGALERHALTRALREESARYESLLHAISDLGVGVAILRDGKFVYANDAMSAISGYDRIELLAMSSILDLVPEEERQEMADRFVRFLAGEIESDSWEAPIRRRDGARRELEGASKLFEINGVNHMLSIARDVTDRLHAALRDRRRAEQLDALARTSKVLAGMREIDELLPAIAAAAGDMARDASAVVGIPIPGHEVIWFGDSGRIPPPLEAAGGVEIVLSEHRAVRTAITAGSLGRPGETREVLYVPMMRGGDTLGVLLLTSVTPFDDIDESIATSLASYAAEVIESARALDRERTMTRRLRELDEIKNSFLAAVSHELRTPLTSVLGFAHTLQRSAGIIGEDERKLLIDRLAVNAEKLERLLADLLDLDRLNRGIVEPVTRPTDVCALILRAVEGFDFPDPRPVHVDVEPMSADLDGPKIERIVENLLSNAVRHTVAGTPIWVRARRQGSGIVIAIEDEGSGVPLALRERIFEPFQQGSSTREHAPGVGIGLSLVARFAALHGGRAWVTDRPGGGASFRVSLPGARLSSSPHGPSPQPTATA